MSDRVVGIDWARGRWVGVVLPGAEVVVAAALRHFLDPGTGFSRIGVDMPIGLPPLAAPRRAGDVAARAFVGPRRASVFMTPPREALEASDYAAGNRLLPEGMRMSRQVWGLRAMIAETGAVADDDPRVIEVHPEVSFRAMAGVPLNHPKSTPEGQAMRRSILASHEIVLADELPPGAPLIDTLDAAAVAWTARRAADGEAESLPPGAAPGARGVIWF